MKKPKLTKLRIGLAFGVAGFADLLQIPIVWMIDHIWMAGELADYALDMATAAATILLLGFHPALFPAFILKAIPGTAVMPTWTACVGYVVYARRNDVTADAPANDAPAEQEQAVEDQSEHSPPPPREAKAASSGLWILIIGALVIGGFIWFKHKPAKRINPVVASVAASAPEVAPTVSRPMVPGKTVVAVGPMEYLSSPYVPLSLPQPNGWRGIAPMNRGQGRSETPLNPEAVCATLEDLLSQTDGIEVLGSQQMRLLRAQASDKTDGLSADAKTAKLRNLAPANIIVLLAIIDLHDERSDFKGYGVESKTLTTKCTLRVQVMKADDGGIIFSKNLSGSKAITQSDAASSSSSDSRPFEAVKTALATLTGDEDFRNAVRGITTKAKNP